MSTQPVPGTRVVVPTVSGPRNVPTYATVIGTDPDNAGYTLVRTVLPVMGEHIHSIADEDITAAPMTHRMHPDLLNAVCEFGDSDMWTDGDELAVTWAAVDCPACLEFRPEA